MITSTNQKKNRDSSNWITCSNQNKNQDDEEGNLDKQKQRRVSFLPSARHPLKSSMTDGTQNRRRRSAPPIFNKEKGVNIGENDISVCNISQWIDRLNNFSKHYNQAWADYVTENPNGTYCWSKNGGYHGFGGLIQYGMGWLPNQNVNQTVIYSTWMTDGMPQMLCGKSEVDLLHAKLLGEFFSGNDLDLIVTGHQPIGDSPLTIQVASEHNHRPKFIIVGDTSYSGDTQWVSEGKRENVGRGKAKSARGDVAVSEILIDQCAKGKVVGVTYHGRLSDGLEYKSSNFCNHHRDSSLVGKLVNKKQLVIEGDTDNKQTDWIVKAKLSDESFLVSSGKGHQVFNAIATKSL